MVLQTDLSATLEPHVATLESPGNEKNLSTLKSYNETNIIN